MVNLFPVLLAQMESQEPSGGGAIVLVWLALVVVAIAGMWRVFSKAGQPGWGVLVPIYNAYLLLKVAARPGWWLLLMLIPFVNAVIAIVVAVDVARNFGKGTGFGLGLAFLPFVFYPILGFGDAEYAG